MKQRFFNLFLNKSCSHAWQWWVAGGTVLAALMAFPLTVKAQVVFPSLPGLNFQTSGRFRCGRIGDWYTTNNQLGCAVNGGNATNNPEANKLHRFPVDITQAMITANGGSITITIDDAESNGLLDEIGNPAVNPLDPPNFAIGTVTCTTLPNNCDPTRFRLLAPDGVTILDTRVIGTPTGTTDPNGTAVTFTVTTPGTYTITSETGAFPIFGDNTLELNDDDNSFIISVPIIVGSSQQALIGQSQGTVQHNLGPGTTLNVPFYFLIGPTLSAIANLDLRNFDLDNGGTINYTSPSGGGGIGTISNNSVWNNNADPISAINIGSDVFTANNTLLAGIGAGDSGVWQYTINGFTNNNQTLFEAQADGVRLPLFDQFPSRAGNFVITPDSDLTTTVGVQVCHAFTVTNNFFTNDIINLSLAGTDPNYTVQLRQADGVTPLTDLDGDGAVDTGILAPGQTGSYTLCVTPNTPNVLIDTTLITGTSFMDRKIQEDPNQPNPQPIQEQSVTKITRIPPPDLSITKTHIGNFAIGQQGTYTLTVTNAPTASPTSGTITVTDTLPANLTFVSGTGTNWTCSAVGQTVTCTNPGPFNPGDTSTITLVVNAVTEGTVTNSATVSTPNETNTTDNTANDPTTITPIADFSLTKTVNVSTPIVGQNIIYTVTLTNSGPSNATGVAVTEQIPAGLTFVSATPSQGTYNNATGLWTVGAVNNGANATLTVTATVNGAGSVTNTAQVSASDQPDNDSTPDNNVPGEDDQASTTITPILPADLSLTKTVNTNAPVVGQNITYTVTLDNAGPANATGVQVTEQLPAGLTFVSATPSQGTYNNTTGLWTVGSVNNGANATLTITATVTGTGSISNTAQVSASDQPDIDSTPNNNVPGEDDQDGITITPVQPADLSLTKTVNTTTPVVGGNITYTVTLNNAGPANATGVAVTEQLPAGLTFVSATPSQGTYNNTTGLWTVGAVNNGANATLTITATVTGTGSISNTAQVSASDQPDIDSTPDNNVPGEDDQGGITITPVQPADLSLTKTVNTTTPVVGGNITYTVTLNNAGPANATGVAVTEQLPAGLTFVSATPSQGSYNNTTGLWTVGSVNNGANATLTITATVTGTGSITNTAQVSASDQPDTDSTPNNNVPGEDDQGGITITPTQPQQPADLSLTKTVNTNAPVVGGNITYTVTLNNAGPANATGVAVTEQLPAGLTFVSATPSQGTYNNTTGLWTVGSVNNGVNATLTITATVTGTDSITNTAQVSASDQPDTDSTPNNNVPGEDDQSSTTITPTQQQPADLSLAKTVNIPNPAPGQNVTYTLTVSNAGPATATNVQVTDVLPAGLTFVSASNSGIFNATTRQVVWNLPSVGVNGTATVTVTARVNTQTPQTNTAQITASDQPDPDSTPGNNNPDEDDQASVTIPTLVADLSLAKTVSDSSPTVGENITYTLTVRNAGPSNATNVQITDRLPAGLTFVSASNGGIFNPTTREIIWNLPAVAVNGSTNLTITATVNTTAALTNSAQITASDQFDPDSTPGNNNPNEDDQASVSIGNETVDLSILKTVNNASPAVGDTIIYTMVVRNLGPGNATNVQISDELPNTLTFVSASSGGTFNATNRLITWSFPAIPANGTVSVTVTATVNTNTPVTNTARIIGLDQTDSNPNNNQSSQTIPAEEADLSVRKTVDSPNAEPGDQITYTVTVSNAGPDAATNVELTDRLPAGLTFNSATPSQGTYNNTNGVWTVGTLPNGASATLRITATLNTSELVTNTAQVTGSDQVDPDSTPGNSNPNEDDQASVSLPTRPNLRLVKRVTALNSTTFTDLVDDPTDPDDNAPNWPANFLQGRIDNVSIQPGDEVEYTIYFLSDGSTTAGNVTLCDLVPQGLLFSPNGYGSGQGISLLNGGVQTFLTNAGDTDGGQFYPAGSFVPPPAGGQSPQPCGRANTNGAIVVNVGDVPSATGTNPAGSVGFIRFRARFIE
jgi:uncharacterized repeat protein (TIGR01451 family)